ncbi:TPR-like protein [Dendrothele bispora CBS 962.96]|uniref:TPR-like protein n=1 Tax=Dendrothele bispora (strain CBS 962.96) TaxID=1314807 RepID=A0A4S8LRN1_DENBC|nr:TPR-like protein [Dendrothele bispora CBS 962.96]
MDPTESLPYLSQCFQNLVWSCLDSSLSRSAVFYGERYFAMFPRSHEARHLYATALLHEGQTLPALTVVDIAAEEQCSGCLEIKAKCCTALGRYRQAREALEKSLNETAKLPSISIPVRTARLGPDQAAMYCRSGTMALKGNLHELASQSFRQALSLNPLLWEAFEGLCALEIDDLFSLQLPVAKRSAPDDQSLRFPGPTSTGLGFFTPEATNVLRGWKPDGAPQPFRLPRDSLASNDASFQAADSTFHDVQRNLRPHTLVPQQHATRPLSSADESGPLPKKLRSTAPQPEAGKSSKSLKLNIDEPAKKPSKSRSNSHSKGGTINSNASVTTRRSNRLTGSKPGQSSKAHGRSHSVDSDEEGVAYSPSPPAIVQSPRSEGSPSSSRWPTLDAGEARDLEVAEQYIYDLMRCFARATRALSVYDSEKCLFELEKLPNEHQQTPWVLAMVGKAHYEKADYSSAQRAFKAVRTFEPYRLWDMEVFSTLLWHTQQVVELSFLAQELLNIAPRSPQAWIAIGNLFSLQKNKQQALTCFRRASQLDPACAYAFTLSGHEMVDDDLDKAITSFQSALRVDPRHYNAWYGLGSCYLRQSKLRLAEYHYRKAVEIHPNNAVLLGCVGMVLERQGDREGARTLFDQAVSNSPDNALARYRRAKMLIGMKEYDAAIKDLEFLHSSSPDEANIVFQLAKVYRLVGDEVKSAHLLARARDIAPRNIGKIKKLLETVKDESKEDSMDEG